MHYYINYITFYTNCHYILVSLFEFKIREAKIGIYINTVYEILTLILQYINLKSYITLLKMVFKKVSRLFLLTLFLLSLFIQIKINAQIINSSQNTYIKNDIITLNLKANPFKNDENALRLRIKVINGNISNLFLSKTKDWVILTKDCPNTDYFTLNTVCLSIAKTLPFKANEEIGVLFIKKISDLPVEVVKDTSNGYAGKDFIADTGVIFKEKSLLNSNSSNDQVLSYPVSYPLNNSNNTSLSPSIIIAIPIVIVLIFALFFLGRSIKRRNLKSKRFKVISLIILFAVIVLFIIALANSVINNQSFKDNKANVSCYCCDGRGPFISTPGTSCASTCSQSGAKQSTSCNDQGISTFQCAYANGTPTATFWNLDQSNSSIPICCNNNYIYSFDSTKCVPKSTTSTTPIIIPGVCGQNIGTSGSSTNEVIIKCPDNCPGEKHINIGTGGGSFTCPAVLALICAPNGFNPHERGYNGTCCNGSVGGPNPNICVGSLSSSVAGGSGGNGGGGCVTSAKNCSVTCSDGKSFSDPCPNTFTSCSQWSTEACQGHTGSGGSNNTTGGTSGGSGNVTTGGTSGGSGNTTTGGTSGGGSNLPKKSICGDKCNSDSDCAASTFGFNTKCINNICASPLCPNDTDPGTLCACKTASGTCGNRCGIWDDGFYPLCGDGISTCTVLGSNPLAKSSTTYCVANSVTNKASLSPNDLAASCHSNNSSSDNSSSSSTSTPLTCYSCTGQSSTCQPFDVSTTSCPSGSSTNAADCLSKVGGSCSNANVVDCGPIDINGDNKLTILDLNDFAAAYGKTCKDHYPQSQGCGGKDYYGDGAINIRDLAYFTSKYGKDSCK